eukprot:403351768
MLHEDIGHGHKGDIESIQKDTSRNESNNPTDKPLIPGAKDADYLQKGGDINRNRNEKLAVNDPADTVAQTGQTFPSPGNGDAIGMAFE